MRLGAYPCALRKDSRAYKAYNAPLIQERHRHRYEFNNRFRRLLEDSGMLVTGVHTPKDLVEIVELRDHPWFLATQFHPEYKSRPEKPHPLFVDFVAAAVRHSRTKTHA